MRFKYNMFSNYDPEDGHSYVRHRSCFFCRSCRSIKILKCRCIRSIGNWESGRLNHNKKTPKLLPTDGVPKRRRPQPLPEILPVWLNIFLIFKTKYFEEVEEPPVSFKFFLNLSFNILRKRKDEVELLVWMILPELMSIIKLK